MPNIQATGTGFYTDGDGIVHEVTAGEWYPDNSAAVVRVPSCFNP